MFAMTDMGIEWQLYYNSSYSIADAVSCIRDLRTTQHDPSNNSTIPVELKSITLKHDQFKEMDSLCRSLIALRCISTRNVCHVQSRNLCKT